MFIQNRTLFAEPNENKVGGLHYSGTNNDSVKPNGFLSLPLKVFIVALDVDVVFWAFYPFYAASFFVGAFASSFASSLGVFASFVTALQAL